MGSAGLGLLPSVSRTLLCRRTWPGLSQAGRSAPLTPFSPAVTESSAGTAWGVLGGRLGALGEVGVLEQGREGADTGFGGR